MDDTRRWLVLAADVLGEPDPEAAEQLLESFRRDRKWNEEAARKQLVRFFEALGPKHPMTVGGRRKLSAVLFS